jgi:hypothetical protein
MSRDEPSPELPIGLDVVELVMLIEETFSIELAAEDCSSIMTTSGLFSLILDKLHLPYQAALELEQSGGGRDYSGSPSRHLVPWNAADVWATLRGIIRRSVPDGQ